METLTIHIKKKSDVSLIKRLLKALNVEIVEESQGITNPELIRRVDDHLKNYNDPTYRKKHYKTVDPNNIWESIL